MNIYFGVWQSTCVQLLPPPPPVTYCLSMIPIPKSLFRLATENNDMLLFTLKKWSLKNISNSWDRLQNVNLKSRSKYKYLLSCLEKRCMRHIETEYMEEKEGWRQVVSTDWETEGSSSLTRTRESSCAAGS